MVIQCVYQCVYQIKMWNDVSIIKSGKDFFAMKHLRWKPCDESLAMKECFETCSRWNTCVEAKLRTTDCGIRQSVIQQLLSPIWSSG